MDNNILDLRNYKRNRLLLEAWLERHHPEILDEYDSFQRSKAIEAPTREKREPNITIRVRRNLGSRQVLGHGSSPSAQNEAEKSVNTSQLRAALSMAEEFGFDSEAAVLRAQLDALLRKASLHSAEVPILDEPGDADVSRGEQIKRQIIRETKRRKKKRGGS